MAGVGPLVDGERARAGFGLNPVFMVAVAVAIGHHGYRSVPGKRHPQVGNGVAAPARRRAGDPLAPSLPRFRPALLRSLAGYDRPRALRDIAAGLVVGIVAIPLALAFAIASGVPPEAGLATAVVAGFLVSAFGGSRVAIGGPTGAFVVIVFGIVKDHGLTGLAIATVMAGIILFLFGLFRFGRVIRFIPSPVIVGFTAGIGAIIFISQLKEILGLSHVRLPGETIGNLHAIATHLGDTNPWALGVAVATVLTIALVKRFLRRVPGPVLALVVFTALSWFLHLEIETIGDRFGDLPRGLPLPSLPSGIAFDRITPLIQPALTIALLGAIESLLCAVVADGMIEDKHDPDQELMAQGIANLASPLFGGIPATGAIARTATSVQNGGTTPVAGMLHAVVVLVFLTVLIPVAKAIPLAVLGGILSVVAYNMSDVPRFKELRHMPRTDAVVLLATFGLTVFVDLIVAVEVGMVLAAFLFMMRMSQVAEVEVIDPDKDQHYGRQQSLEGKMIPDGVTLYSIDGPFFFGAVERFQRSLARITKPPRVVVFRMRHVPYMDASGLSAFETAIKQLHRKGTTVILSAVQTQPLDLMMRSGFLRNLGDHNLAPHIDAALDRAREVLAEGDEPSHRPPHATP